ncbi:MAG: electron transfer flavoprotein subunit beta/FixA family protein [Planctomycetes bacterium]|nr:electron transfer flavoprotein subunit beta/FixA family protein [Planctomycetota bacterium]
MKAFVFVKRVPATTTRVRLASGSGGPARAIQTQGVELAMNPYDEIGLAEAVRRKERAGGGEVVAVTVGPDEAQSVLRTALAMGADAALHVRAAAPTGLELDGLQTATLLAAAVRERPFDLLLFGRLAVDTQASQVGTLTARLLGVPSVADVTKVELLDGCVRLHHLVDGRVEVVECPLPAALTAQKSLVEPRYPSVKQILAAKSKRIETIEASVPEPVLETLSIELPPPRSPGRIVGEGPAAARELVRLLREEAKVI